MECPQTICAVPQQLWFNINAHRAIYRLSFISCFRPTLMTTTSTQLPTVWRNFSATFQNPWFRMTNILIFYKLQVSFSDISLVTNLVFILILLPIWILVFFCWSSLPVNNIPFTLQSFLMSARNSFPYLLCLMAFRRWNILLWSAFSFIWLELLSKNRQIGCLPTTWLSSLHLASSVHLLTFLLWKEFNRSVTWRSE